MAKKKTTKTTKKKTKISKCTKDETERIIDVLATTDSQREAAKELGVSPVVLARWVTKQHLTPKVLKRKLEIQRESIARAIIEIQKEAVQHLKDVYIALVKKATGTATTQKIYQKRNKKTGELEVQGQVIGKFGPDIKSILIFFRLFGDDDIRQKIEAMVGSVQVTQEANLLIEPTMVIQKVNKILMKKYPELAKGMEIKLDADDVEQNK